MLKQLALLIVVSVAAIGLYGAQPAPVQADAFPETIPLPDGWFPEGIVSGRGTDFYAGSLIDGRIYKGDLRSGTGRVLVGSQPAARIAVGLAYDGRSDYLFVAGGGAVFSPNTVPSARVYDAKTGAEIVAFSPNGGFVNDVIVTRDAAYFTDSFIPVLYRLPLGPKGQLLNTLQLETIPLSGDYMQVNGFNSNGIEATPNGKWLIIVNSSTGLLYRVDPHSGTAQEILVPTTIPGGDGLLLDGKTLYVLADEIEVVALSPDFLSGEVTRTIPIPNAVTPTTIAEFGSSLYAVDAKFPFLGDLATSFVATRVSKK